MQPGDMYRLRTAPTRVRELMPLMERAGQMRAMEMQLRDLPRMRMMDGEHMRLLSPSRIGSPRLRELRARRSPRPSESRLRAEKEQKAKAKADSLKK
jgi:hypothetical protein